MTTRPTGACLVLVTQVNMVRGPHPTKYCRGEQQAARKRCACLRSAFGCAVFAHVFAYVQLLVALRTSLANVVDWQSSPS